MDGEIEKRGRVELSWIVYAQMTVGTGGDDLILSGPGERPDGVGLDWEVSKHIKDEQGPKHTRCGLLLQICERLRAQ